MAFERIINKLTAINVPQVLRTVLRPSLGLIEELQRKQLFAGIDSFGKPITPKYTKNTIGRKKRKRPPQPTDRVTLKDTGKFYKGLKAEIKDNKIDVIGQDPKTQELEDKYEEENPILGLTEANIELVLARAREPIITQIQKALLS